MEDAVDDSQVNDLAQETPARDLFIPLSVHEAAILSGQSYTHHSAKPRAVARDASLPCVLGVDEAGRGPVLGPMVYGVFYLPLPLHHSLLAETHHFDDSKVLTPSVRSKLMETLCREASDLHESCGWATRVMSARDISAGMLRSTGTYNLNAQAMDATIDLIKEVFAIGVNVQEIYIDTIGSPKLYQSKLEKIFPATKITVAKKADSLYPCVSAASVCAKVTRDAALEVSYKSYASTGAGDAEAAAESWGSGYPSDSKCTNWLRANMDSVFGWGAECRFSWGTAKDMLEGGNESVKFRWPETGEQDQAFLLSQYLASADARDTANDGVNTELVHCYGMPAAATAI